MGEIASNKERIEKALTEGGKDELYEMRLWLFRESVRLENQESAIEARIAQFERERQDFKEKMRELQHGLNRDREKLDKDHAFFEEQLRILKDGYDKLSRDKKCLEDERDCFEKEKMGYERVRYSQISVFFKGVDSPLSLKKRYRELIKIFHPDNLGGDQEIIQEINQEYAVLCKDYDTWMKA